MVNGECSVENLGVKMSEMESFFRGKRILVTGHTGFKGSWLCHILLNFGADVYGFSHYAPTTPNLYEIVKLDKRMKSVIGYIQDLDSLKKAFDIAQPEIVLHLAAQPLVRESYKDPRWTYETNVMGTVNILECLRFSSSVRSFLNITTDKVYKNREWCWGYREDEALDGFDPYSNSKSCSELITHSYKSSFFADEHLSISTARAGNVIGGGDFSLDRIIPDCVRAMQNNTIIKVRNPHSTRPYQHVLEPLMAYLLIAQKQYDNSNLSGWYNIGPDESDCISTGDLVDLFCRKWGEGASWACEKEENAPHEANFLKLDSSKFKVAFNWKPRWHIEDAIEKTCEWSKEWLAGGDVVAVMDKQIQEYMS